MVKLIKAITGVFGFFGLIIGATLVLAEPEGLTPEMQKTANELIDKALDDELGYKLIESLTTEIGPRLAGTEQEARARDWALEKLQSLGFENIRSEPFKVKVWTRSEERAEIVSPYPQILQVTALGNSVSTPKAGLKGEIVRFNTLLDLENASLDALEGKIAFVDEYMTRTQDGSGYGVAVRKRSGAAVEAAKRGAIASLIRSVGTDSHRFPHTGGMQYLAGVTPIPIAALSAPDADQLARALERSDSVTVQLKLAVNGGGRTDGAWVGEPDKLADSANIVAEIPGQTDEIILVGAHLDSWDLGTGAVDDGAGVGIVTAAAKLVGDLPIKPKRTIRVVLFGAEEVGLVGARAYAEKHKDSLDKHIVAAESDFGAGKIWRMRTRWAEEKLPMASVFHRVLNRLGIAPGDNVGRGGPDLFYLRAAGVPVVELTQNGWDYFNLHHTHDDTFDKISKEDIAQNVAAYAAFIYLASEIEGKFTLN